MLLLSLKIKNKINSYFLFFVASLSSFFSWLFISLRPLTTSFLALYLDILDAHTRQITLCMPKIEINSINSYLLKTNFMA